MWFRNIPKNRMQQFGLIVAGRPVQTDFTPCGPNKCMVSIYEFDKINHIVVFAFGEPFPEGYAASVHLNIPVTQGGSGNWRLLGIMANNKPSAIFKITGLKSIQSYAMNGAGSNEVCLGIAIEPMESILAQMKTMETCGSDALVPYISNPPLETIASNVMMNLYYYVMSFSNDSQNFPHEPCIPLKLFEEWWKNTLRKLKTNPESFCKSAE